MARTNIDIDDDACRVVMDRYRLASKREAVNYALRLVTAEELDLAVARARCVARVDSLIGAVALRHDVPVLHADADFATLARHTPLAVHAAP